MNAKHNKKKGHHTVIGKLYMNGCIHCAMMSKAWQDMRDDIKKDMKLVESHEEDKALSNYTKYVSPDGSTVVEIIEIEANDMDKELPHVQKKYSSNIDIQGGYPTLFKIHDNEVSYYGGERTSDKMKKWYMAPKTTSGGKKQKEQKKRTQRKRKNNKTKKNKTRSVWW